MRTFDPLTGEGLVISDADRSEYVLASTALDGSLFRMLRQNGGRLSKRARQREFAKLTGGEVRQVEEAYADTIETSA